jgi:hypothetical protein
VTPLIASTIASLFLIKRLKKVDFPTLGLPTIATIPPIRVYLIAKVSEFVRYRLGVIADNQNV